AQGIEQAARIAYLLPLHDVRPDLARVAERMERLRTDMDQLGTIGAGAGHYGLGRGDLALHRYEEAKDELEQAWRDGVRTPERRASLSMALGQLYARGLAEAEAIADHAQRQRKRREVERRYREPARAYLAGSAGSSALGEAYIAFLEDNDELALLRSEQAF